MFFDVIDTQTGQYPNLERIALTEDWARGLVYCDVSGFAITDDGCLILMDDCDNVAHPPEGRFKVVALDATLFPNPDHPPADGSSNTRTTSQD